MNPFRKRTASSPDAPGERRCLACGNGLADAQLACLECGAVDAGSRERRWIVPTGGVIAVALFLVTSASFAATTALNTGDPRAMEQKPPVAVAQAPAPPPASGAGAAPNSAQQDNGKGPDLGNVPSPPGGGDAAATGKAAPAGDKAKTDAGSGSGDSAGSGSNAGSGNSGGSGGSGRSGSTKPGKPEPKPVKISEWPDGREAYTVVVYKFDSKADAKAKAREVARKGLPAGVLDSDKYASLEPGSWLVYIGEFDSAQKAERANGKYENAGYPGEVRYVGQTAPPESAPSGSG